MINSFDRLADAMGRVVDAYIDAWATVINALADAITGIDIVETENVAVGTIVRAGSKAFTHPLDANRLRHHNNPTAALAGAASWISDRARRQADSAIAKLDAAMEGPHHTDGSE